jgi:hypothetical protein
MMVLGTDTHRLVVLSKVNESGGSPATNVEVVEAEKGK